jgi:hypothetical protein
VTFRLRNGLGVEQAVPTEFVRPADHGKPALRRGVGLALFEVPRDPTANQSNVNRPPPGVERPPTRDARFDAGDASRMLAPTDSFEAISLDLNDWFAPLGPGTYRLQITFGKGSGLREGETNDVGFTMGVPDNRSH